MRAYCLLFCAPLCAQPALKNAIEKIAAEAGGTMGVSALHVETGRELNRLATQAFPMASVFKLPVAMTVLYNNEHHGPRLEKKVKLRASDIRPFRSPIAQRAPRGGIKLSIAELLDAMLIDSDNTAADVLLRLCGDGNGVTAHMRRLGLTGILVNRSEGEMAIDYAGVTSGREPSRWTLAWFEQSMKSVPPDKQRAAAQRALADYRDVATPGTMVAMLRMIVLGKALSQPHTDLLLDRMRRTVPAAARIKSGVPPGTTVAHRPGSGGENEGVSLCTNDVGIVTLPDGGHLILAVFLKGSNKDTTAREHSIAEVTRAVYNAWLLPQ